MSLVSFASTFTNVAAVTALFDEIDADVVGAIVFVASTPPPANVTSPPEIAAATGVDLIVPVDDAVTCTEPLVAVTFEFEMLADVDPPFEATQLPEPSRLPMQFSAFTKPTLPAPTPMLPAKPTASARIPALFVAVTVTLVPLTSCPPPASESRIRASTVLLMRFLPIAAPAPKPPSEPPANAAARPCDRMFPVE